MMHLAGRLCTDDRAVLSGDGSLSGREIVLSCTLEVMKTSDAAAVSITIRSGAAPHG
jgi:hypothetical protein